MRFLTVLSVLLLLGGCAKPTSKLPVISQDEVKAEREYQETYLYENDFEHLYKKKPTKSQMEKRLAQITRKVGPAAIELCNQLRLRDKTGEKRRCLFDVELGPHDDTRFNAYADGDKVVIGRKLFEYIEKDEQLAFIIAHEFSHNIMKHLDDAQQNIMGGAILGAVLDAAVSGAAGSSTGGSFSKLGAQMARLSYSADYEYEADYIGLYIMKRAGYDISEAAKVWRLMSAVNPDSIYTSTTHPTSPERFVLMNRTVQEIKTKQRHSQEIMPDFKVVE